MGRACLILITEAIFLILMFTPAVITETCKVNMRYFFHKKFLCQNSLKYLGSFDVGIVLASEQKIGIK